MAKYENDAAYFGGFGASNKITDFERWLERNCNKEREKELKAWEDGEIDLKKITRLEVISGQRDYTNYNVEVRDISMQDNNRTMKIFISERGRKF